MTFILMGLLVLISVGCFLEGKAVERRGVKLILSLSLSILIPFLMTGSLQGLVSEGMIQGVLIYVVIHSVIPVISFFIFQLLLYQIKLFE
ncbi:hypothetical protein [Bacillus suaedaesalsae]|uniref:Uncharacterized protein n=1 Tax=Bacillus suaedaesalsae TaxID=2810349 RepID=A0ABS2DHR7_9BACI|nr:hypothetical protein [Bacillus suaedaesalsae]MBM6617984.1 hypothetical protein [Bacillus suaedaesalsae]